MMKILVSGFAIGLLVFVGGCSGSSTGDADAAAKAAAQVPKSVDELPTDMPPEARRAAAGAMGQAQAMQNQANDPARIRAMQEMQRQRGQ